MAELLLEQFHLNQLNQESSQVLLQGFKNASSVVSASQQSL